MDNQTKIGILLPQSRQYKTLDRDFMRGLKLNNPNVKFYIESIGIGAEEKLIIDKIQKMNLQEDINIIIGFFGHYNMSHVYEYAANNDILLIASDLGATMPYAQPKLKGVYINSFALTESCFLLGEYFKKNNYSKVASATSYYDSGYGMLSAIEASFNENTNFSGHYITPLHPREDEAKYMEAQIDASAPDVVFGFFSGLYATENADFIAQNKIVYKYPFYVTPFSITSKVLEEHRKSPFDMYVVSSWLHENNKECMFSSQYTKAYNDNPSVFSLLGYEISLIIIELIKDSSNSFDSLINKITKLSINSPRGIINFDNQTNRTYFNHHIYQIESSGSTIAFKKIKSLENNGHFIKTVTGLSSPPKAGGWQNAYLCH